MKCLSIIVILMTCFAFNAMAQTSPDCPEDFDHVDSDWVYTWQNTPYTFTIDARTVSNGDTIGTLQIHEDVASRDTTYQYEENSGEMIIQSPANVPFSLSAITRTRVTEAFGEHNIASTLTRNGNLTQGQYVFTVAYQSNFNRFSYPSTKYCAVLTPSVTVTINVQNFVNVAPVFAGGPRTRTVASGTGSGVNIGAPITATDANGDTLTYNTTGLTRSDLWSVDADTGQFTTQAEIPNEAITDTFTLTATDPTGLTASIGVTITVNTGPVFAPPDPRMLIAPSGTPAGANIGAPITATHPEGDTLTYSTTGLTNSTLWGVNPNTGQFTTKAAISNTVITDTFTLTATDSDDQTDTIGVTITVATNQAPSFDPPNPRELRVASGVPPNTVIGVVTATDPEGATLTYSADVQRQGLWDLKEGTETGEFITKTLTPHLISGDTLTEEVTLTATDPVGLTATIEVRLIIDRRISPPDPPDTGNPNPGTGNPGTGNPGTGNPGTGNPGTGSLNPFPASPPGQIFSGPLCYTATYHPRRFGTHTPHVFISAIEVEVDSDDRNTGSSIYSPVAIEIYVDPQDGRLDLNGWNLELGVSPAVHKDYPLTTENSVIVDNVVRIANEDVENGIPITHGGFTGAEMPAFFYRLYDPQNRQIDIVFSCYYQGNVFQKLSEMENPRLERLILDAPGTAINPEDYKYENGLASLWHPANNPLGAAPSAPVLKRTLKTAVIWAEIRRQ